MAVYTFLKELRSEKRLDTGRNCKGGSAYLCRLITHGRKISVKLRLPPLLQLQSFLV